MAKIPQISVYPEPEDVVKLNELCQALHIKKSELLKHLIRAAYIRYQARGTEGVIYGG